MSRFSGARIRENGLERVKRVKRVISRKWVSRCARLKRVKRVIAYPPSFPPAPFEKFFGENLLFRRRWRGIADHALHAFHAPRRLPPPSDNQRENIS